MEHEGKKEVQHITLGLILCWVIGIILLLMGLGFLITNVLAGLLILLGGVIMLPPVNDFFRKKYSVHLSGILRFIIAAVLFGIGMSVTTSAVLDEARSRAESRPQSEQSATSNTRTTTGRERLELVSYSCGRQYGFFHIRGQVKNISDRSMDSVMAVGSTYTEGGTFVKSDSALIEYNPILPGQTSPFEVLGTDNPAIDKCQVEFKEFFGGTIPTKRSE